VIAFRRKWTNKIWRKNDSRIVKRFAWLPIVCSNKYDNRVEKDTRWLQTVYIKIRRWASCGESGWLNVEFVTKQLYDEYCEGKEKWER